MSMQTPATYNHTQYSAEHSLLSMNIAIKQLYLFEASSCNQ